MEGLPDLIVVTDGACRGNPGPMAAAFLLFDADGKDVYHEGRALGPGTNNRAEYQAILNGLTEAKRRGAKRIEVFSDSEVAVRQLKGEYKVKEPELQELSSRVKDLGQSFVEVEFVHANREHPWIARADKLANRALDDEERRARGG